MLATTSVIIDYCYQEKLRRNVQRRAKESSMTEPREELSRGAQQDQVS